MAPLADARESVQKSAPIRLDVDATAVPRGIYRANLTIPAEPGQMTLFFPKWIPGTHGPTGPVGNLVGLKTTVDGKSIPWRRDDVDMFAFHCDIPNGAHTLEVVLDHVMGGRGMMASSPSPHQATIRWNEILLYPKGKRQQEIQFQASLRLPEGWKFGTALPMDSRDGQLTRFAPVSLETLVDSPVICGKFFREIPIGTDHGISHFLELACDSADGLEVPGDVITQHERLVTEAGALFGARHYRSYRFLVALGKGRGGGLEHHESSDNGASERFMVDKSVRNPMAFLLPHEFTHSWNGKYRRPAGLVTADFQEPEKTSLLWIYEGLTEYIGTVLTARSGLLTPEETRDYIALTANTMQNHRGRQWRPLLDTAVAAPLTMYGGGAWDSWRRTSGDYYDEGVLIWLEVDARIRQLTAGSRSLNDFCRRFYGGENGPPAVKPYTLDDVVTELNSVAPHDWKSFFNRRLTSTQANAPLEGIEQSGWRLDYQEKPSTLFKESQTLRKSTDLASSIGLILSPEGSIIDVIPGTAADRAGLAPGMKLVAVNSRRWSAEGLSRSIKETKTDKRALELLMESDEFFKTFTLDYHDGLKYPRLVRDESKPDLLSQILKPLVASPGNGKQASR
jgi:predicted metalloprotease with PDZ domain